MDHEDVRSVIHSEHTHTPGRGGHLHWHTPKAPPNQNKDFTSECTKVYHVRGHLFRNNCSPH